MKAAAAVLVASFGLVAVGCAPDRPAQSSSPSAAFKKSAEDPLPRPRGQDPVAASREEDANLSLENPPSVTLRAPSEAEVRDAKEAAEEAARKIVNVTIDAAALIRGVGASAVQAVRQSTAREPEARTDDPEEVSEADISPETHGGAGG